MGTRTLTGNAVSLKAGTRTVLIIVSATVGLLLAALLAGAWYESTNTVSVSVLNDGRGVTRLSGCVDDSLDLDAGTRASIDVSSSGRTGCNVFVDGIYNGCLILHHRDAAEHKPIPIFTRIDREMSQHGCETLA